MQILTPKRRCTTSSAGGSVVRCFLIPGEARFDQEQFIVGWSQTGFDIIATIHAWNWFGWYVRRKGLHAKDKQS